MILHRPGAELSRLTPRDSDKLLFDGLPEVSVAQDEHDVLAELLKSRDVEVLLLGDLVSEALRSGAARMHGISAAVDSRRLGPTLAQDLSAYLRTLDPSSLAHVLIAGMTFTELPLAGSELSLVRRMHHGDDFVVDPLPNLLFVRDSSLWIGPRVAIPTLALPARMRETSLTDLVYAHHPRFLGVRRAYESRSAPVEGGDVLLLSAGVVAVGVGERTTPAGAEALARSLFDDDLVHTVLAVPVAQGTPRLHLDSVCTLVDTDAVLMRPEAADGLTAFPIRCADGAVTIADAQPLLRAAADAMGLDRLRVIHTAPGSGADGTECFDNGSDTLALAPGVVVGYERNAGTNARLEEAGIEVLGIPGLSGLAGLAGLGKPRGGPRAMSCPIARDRG